MIVDRYLIRQFAGTAFLGWFLLSGIFAAFVAAGILADAAAGKLSAAALWHLVLLRCLIGAEVIVPTALYFAVLFTCERLHRDRELVALMAGGMSRLRLLRPIVSLSLFVCLIVAVLALVIRPWAYRETYLLEERSSQTAVTVMDAGSFYHLTDGFVVTAGAIDEEAGLLRDVFARQEERGFLRLIRAETGRILEADDRGAQVIEFNRGQALIVGIGGRGEGDRRYRFDRLRFRWVPEDFGYKARSRRARPMAALLASEVPRDIAEWQWRFTLPFLTLGMTLLAGALGMIAIGRVTAMRLVVAIVAYVVVFNIAAGARSVVENGNLPPWPGIWWVPLVPQLLIAAVLARTRP